MMVKCTFLGKLKTLLFIAVLSLTFLTSGIGPVFAANNSLSLQDKEAILSTPAFYVVGCINGNVDASLQSVPHYGVVSKTADEWLALSDEQFKAAMRQNIIWAIKQKEAGAQLYWQPEGIALVTKVAPDLSKTVETQTKAKPEASTQRSLVSAKTTGNFTPGSDSKDFIIDNITLGITIWRYHMIVNWAWDTTKITSHSYSCSANVYSGGTANGWTYIGVNSASGSWVVNYYAWKQKTVGHFSGPIQQSYPWLQAIVQAGDVYTNTGGFN